MLFCFFFAEKKSGHDLGTILWSEFCHVFRAVMADSPALNYAPSFDCSYIEDIYQQIANFALVPTFLVFHFFFV